MRWGGTALCSLAVVAAVLIGNAPAASGAAPGAVARAAADAPPLTLQTQTNWVTPDQPWFNMTVGIGASVGPVTGLRVSVTYYARLNGASQLQQAIEGSPGGAVLGRQPDVPVAAGSQGQSATASSCVTVLRNTRDTPPPTGTGACAPGTLSIDMGCTPLTGTCGDVYPVGVALYRQNSTTPVARLTTFLTYQEAGAPGSIGTGGPLDVGLVLPASTAGSTKVLAAALAAQPLVPATLAVNPAGIERSQLADPKATSRALAQLASLDGEQVLDQPYEPIDLAALSEAKIASEIDAQTTRGDELLRAAGLRPTSGPWVDTASPFTQGDAADLAAGLQDAGASHLVMNEADLASAGVNNYLTFAQPFTLDLGHGPTVTAVAADSALGARFTADPGDPVLSAEQVLAGLFFVHFENASLTQARGVVIMPPAEWRASKPFLTTLLGGLNGNAALRPVTLDQLFTQVPVGGNREAAVRHLQNGPATHGISHSAAVKIATGRQQLSSYTDTVSGHVPPSLVALSDALLGTEVRGLSTARRAAVISAYQRAFEGETARVSLAGQETVTFTARQASIPITVLSSAPYPVNVIVTLTSDKFTFPNGNTRRLLLDRPTTSVRVTAQARTSGDRLPIDVTLHTSNGRLMLAHAVLTVHSTAISFVGVALTILAGAVLLLWWARTWRKARRRRLRAN